MQKVRVDADRCVRCGMCYAQVPDTFEMGEDLESVVINDEVNESVIEISEMCPVNAIQIVDEEEKEDEIKEAA